MTLEIPSSPTRPRRADWRSLRRKKPPLPLGALAPRGTLVRPGFAALATSRRRLLEALVAAGGGARVRPKHDPLLVLVNRITQGFNRDEFERAKSLGYQAYLEEQLDHLAIDDSALDARLAGFTTLTMSPKQIVDNFPIDITLPYYEIKGAALLRSVFSKRQLFERMCEFWNDHFSIDHNKGDAEYLFKPEDDRLTIRQHALASFPALLSASAHGAAMLFYLDNWLNVAGAIQENYARELMELHTLGVNGGYTEQDIHEVAECFTGWTLEGDFSSPDYLRGTFISGYHQGGSKVVLGTTIPAIPARQNAQRVLDVLSVHPSTARFLAGKLIRWFLTETPPQAFVDQVAQTYLDEGGDIKAMLRVILAEENMVWNSPLLGRKFRRPFHLLTSILRGMGAEVSDFYYSLYYLISMGHSPFDWSPPNGYPDKVGVWGNSLLPRWTFLSHLFEGYIFGVELPSPLQVFELLDIDGPASRPGLAHRINNRILGRALSFEEEQIVQEFVDSRPLVWPTVAETIALAASMPGYQWY